MTALSYNQYTTITNWILNNLIPTKTIQYSNSNGTLKHIFEAAEDGFYVDGDCFTQIMIDCGFAAKQSKSGYWYFNVSKKSPAIKQYYGY